ncbi:MAG: ferrous iron transport protein A [Candidatus Lokiarchaeota archaeon]|nr:ferrous iron transport protein A [Candidatus Lokiarchaeota archaeon]
MIELEPEISTTKKIREIPLIKCLTECEEEEETVIKSVKCGHKAKRRLANLGLVPGTKIKKKKAAPFRGPLKIIVKGTTLVIGRGLASKILVECDKACNF